MGFASALPLAAAALLLPADIAGEFRPFLWSPPSDSGHAVVLVWQAYVPAVLLYLGGVFWTLGYDTVYALQDIEDDAMVGVKSSARRLASAVRPGVAVFYGISLVLAALAGLSAGLGPLFWIGLALYAAHLARQVVRLDRTDGALALTLFKSNREAGFILLAALALGSLGQNLIGL
jgi:4-hydroxybenzoate polyprenyltransferase